MAVYKTTDFENRVNEMRNQGFYISDADYNLGMQNPDAGISILNFKMDYKNATTPEEKEAANRGANNIRSSYGNYTGGGDGSSFKVDTPTPGSFSMDPYKNPYEEQTNAALDKVTSREDWSFEAFKNPYADQTQTALDKVLNPEEWNYNAEGDQAWQAAKKSYLREADRATANTMGQAAMMTGGMPSTAAITAAQQAGDYYRTQLADQQGDYINADYQRYRDRLAGNQDQLSILRQLGLDAQDQYNLDRSTSYQNYIDSTAKDFDVLSALRALGADNRDQYDTDRNFGYNQWTDDLGFRADREQTAYDRKQDDYNKQLTEEEIAKQDREYNNAMSLDLANQYMALYESTGDSKYRKQALEILDGILAGTKSGSLLNGAAGGGGAGGKEA